MQRIIRVLGRMREEHQIGISKMCCANVLYRYHKVSRVQMEDLRTKESLGPVFLTFMECHCSLRLIQLLECTKLHGSLP